MRPIRPAPAGVVVRGDQQRYESADPLFVGIVPPGLLPTLGFSDPHGDPHWGGRGRIPVDGSASIGLPVSSGWTTTDVRGPPWHELGMRYRGNWDRGIRVPLPPPYRHRALRLRRQARSGGQGTQHPPLETAVPIGAPPAIREGSAESPPRRGGVALAYEGAPIGLVSTVEREGAGRGAPLAPGRLFSSYRAPRGFGVFGHPCAKVLMGQWLFDTIPSKLDVAGSSPVSRSNDPADLWRSRVLTVARRGGDVQNPAEGASERYSPRRRTSAWRVGRRNVRGVTRFLDACCELSPHDIMAMKAAIPTPRRSAAYASVCVFMPPFSVNPRATARACRAARTSPARHRPSPRRAASARSRTDGW
jgi:hypothetical protein